MTWYLIVKGQNNNLFWTFSILLLQRMLKNLNYEVVF